MDLPADNFPSPAWWRRARRVFRAGRQQGQRLGGVTTWDTQEVSGTVWLEEEFAWVGQTVSPGGSCFWGVGATGGFHTGK